MKRKRRSGLQCEYGRDVVCSSSRIPFDGSRVDGDAPPFAESSCLATQDALPCRCTVLTALFGKDKALRSRARAFRRIYKDLDITRPTVCLIEAIERVKQLRMSYEELRRSNIGLRLRRLGANAKLPVSVLAKVLEVLSPWVESVPLRRKP